MFHNIVQLCPVIIIIKLTGSLCSNAPYIVKAAQNFHCLIVLVFFDSLDLAGEAMLLEGTDGVDGTPEDAEKKVFEGLDLEYVPPEYRVTY